MQNQPLKLTLLKRFYLLVIVINSMALGIDLYLEKYTNFTIEALTVLALATGFWYLKESKNILKSAYFFLIIIALTLFSLIYVNHFATLSIFFAPLLPLVVLLFLGARKTLYIMLIHIVFFGILLYVEWHINPQNPIFNDKNVLFNLGYALIIIYLFGIFYHLFIMKTFEDLESANRKNTLLLGEIHHRVKNNLNVIASILGLQTASLSQKRKNPFASNKNTH